MNFDKRLKAENPTGASITFFKQPEASMFPICYSEEKYEVYNDGTLCKRYRNTQWRVV